MTIAVLFHRLGPYHHARLSALRKETKIIAVEFSSVDNTYAWETIVPLSDYKISQLFTDADVDTKPILNIVERIRSELSSAHCNVVAIPGWSSPAALAALDWCCQTGTPAILMADSTEHDESRRWWKEWIKASVVRLFSAAVVGGTPHVDYLRALGFPRDRIFKGYDVVDNNYFLNHSNAVRASATIFGPRYSLPEQYFLTSNRFIEKKNLHRLIEAYAIYVAQVGASAWCLIILGDGTLNEALINLVDRLGLTEKVLFPGFKQYNDLPVYYGLASAYIQASTTEQWGLVVNEAMASGLPVLVSARCGCTPDLVQEGLNGFTFDPYSIKEMSAQMLRIASGNCDLVAMGLASREIIASWSPETFAAGMMNAATVALANSPARARWFDRALLWMLMRR